MGAALIPLAGLAMPEVAGTLVVVAVVAVIAGLCARSIFRRKKSGGCSGDCCHCKGCH